MTLANGRLHATLIEASGRPRLVRIIRQLWDATEVYRSVYYAEPENRELAVDEHRAILDAVRARDTGRLLDALAAHRKHAIAALSPVLSRRDAGA
jgi:DNA-binding GntR family transcriptional regulator